MKNQNRIIGPSQGERALLQGPENEFMKILANGA